VSCRGEIESDGRLRVQAIQYHDTYERRSQLWRFVRRRHLLFYDGDERGELPEQFATWRAFHAR
jgi:hypothetical protein